jgi:hypothetical protein
MEKDDLCSPSPTVKEEGQSTLSFVLLTVFIDHSLSGLRATLVDADSPHKSKWTVALRTEPDKREKYIASTAKKAVVQNKSELHPCINEALTCARHLVIPTHTLTFPMSSHFEAPLCALRPNPVHRQFQSKVAGRGASLRLTPGG